MKIKYFDMFAGIGGFRTGLQNAGDIFLPVGWCEIDKYAAQAYNAIYEPEGELYFGDARTIKPNELPDINLICAGFPCQSFSIAGKRKKFEDDARGTLFFEVARIAEAKRPAFLLLENVPGLLSHDEGRTFDAIITTLVELGYGIEWCVHNSACFGVPQQRRRLYIVCSLGGRCTGKILPLECGSSENLREIIPGPQGQRVYSPDGASSTLTAGSGGWGGKTGLYFIDMNHPPTLTEQARCLIARYDSGVGNHKGVCSGVLVEDDEPRAILTPDRETVRQKGRRIKEPGEDMFCITATDKHGVVHHGRIRKLMPIEAWRLQGFSDEQFYKAQATGLNDGRLYKMAGNSVTTNVVTAVGKKLIEEIQKIGGF